MDSFRICGFRPRASPRSVARRAPSTAVGVLDPAKVLMMTLMHYPELANLIRMEAKNTYSNPFWIQTVIIASQRHAGMGCVAYLDSRPIDHLFQNGAFA